MRIRIKHSMNYKYTLPARRVMQVLKLSPQHTHGQHITNWRIDLNVENDQEGILRSGLDTFHNLTHTTTIEGPVSGFQIHMSGDVETTDTSGIIRDGHERFAPEIFLRQTSLTQAQDGLRVLANKAGGKSEDTLDIAHRLMESVHESMRLQEEATAQENDQSSMTTAAQSLNATFGKPRDFAHVLIAIARIRGIPARFVSGYWLPTSSTDQAIETVNGAESLHAWTELYVPVLGWIGFDPVHNRCPTDQHIRLAIGLDGQDADPVRTSSYGGEAELTTQLAVKMALSQTQS